MRADLVRRLLPLSVLPLVLICGGLASSPWLRAFPAATLAVPLFGATILSTLVPQLTTRSSRRLWVSGLVDVVAFVVYTLLVVLHDPLGFGSLYTGLAHGPAQLLSFALPLVSPRSLMVAPIALAWLAGALAGEALARRWYTVIPYAAWLVTFGLAYAATNRATSGSAGAVRGNDTLLAGGLLLALLLLRVVQTWTHLYRSQTAAADSALPVRGVAVGALITVLVALVAAGSVQSSAFAGPASAPQRIPSVNQSQPLSPLAFVAGLRADASTRPLFSVSLDRSAPAYFGLASLDFYDGDGWSFDRTFRPSGGVVPADVDPGLAAPQPSVTQRYRIPAGPMTTVPWMPSLYRVQKVSGTSVSVDAASGMVVPNSPLHAGDGYTVRSDASHSTLGQLDHSSLPATSTPPIDSQLPGPLQATLSRLVTAFSGETGVPTTPALPFLQALQKDLHDNYGLAGAAPPRPGRPSSPTPSATRTGGTGFSDVLASIVGTQRSATPEQYATLFALLARQVGVPARVVTGFRIGTAATLAAGTYDVTGAQAWTWVELPVHGSGWIVADASPSTVSGDQPDASVGAASSPASSAVPTRNALITQGDGGHAVAPRSAVPHHSGRPHRPIVPILVGVIAALVLVLLAPVLRKRLRLRRRRRAPDPRRQVVGAWQESLDVLAESGLRDLGPLSGEEVAQATAGRFGPAPALVADRLGRSANAAIYSQAVPIGRADADAAWQDEKQLRRLVHRALPIHTRIFAGLCYHRPPRSRVVAPLSWTGEPSRSRSRRRSGRHR